MEAIVIGVFEMPFITVGDNVWIISLQVEMLLFCSVIRKLIKIFHFDLKHKKYQKE
jgi:hypothetical protein